MDKEKIIKAIEPFAFVGGECHDTKFRISMNDRDGSTMIILTDKHFKKLFDVYSELQGSDKMIWQNENDSWRVKRETNGEQRSGPLAPKSDGKIGWAFISGAAFMALLTTLAGIING